MFPSLGQPSLIRHGPSSPLSSAPDSKQKSKDVCPKEQGAQEDEQRKDHHTTLGAALGGAVLVAPAVVDGAAGCDAGLPALGAGVVAIAGRGLGQMDKVLVWVGFSDREVVGEREREKEREKERDGKRAVWNGTYLGATVVPLFNALTGVGEWVLGLGHGRADEGGDEGGKRELHCFGLEGLELWLCL